MLTDRKKIYKRGDKLNLSEAAREAIDAGLAAIEATKMEVQLDEK